MCPDVRKPPRVVGSGGLADPVRAGQQTNVDPKVQYDRHPVKPPSRMEGCWIQGTDAAWDRKIGPGAKDTRVQQAVSSGLGSKDRGRLRLRGSRVGPAGQPRALPEPESSPAVRSLNRASLRVQKDLSRSSVRAASRAIRPVGVITPQQRNPDSSRRECCGRLLWLNPLGAAVGSTPTPDYPSAQAQSDTAGRAPAKRVAVGPTVDSSQHNALLVERLVSPRLRAGGPLARRSAERLRSCNAPRALVQKARSKESGIVAASKALTGLAAEKGYHPGYGAPGSGGGVGQGRA